MSPTPQPSDPRIPPCYKCKFREKGENSLLCLLDPKFPEPIFTAVKWRGPDFLCFQESHQCAPQAQSPQG